MNYTTNNQLTAKKRLACLFRLKILLVVIIIMSSITGLQAQTMYIKDYSGAQTSYLLNEIKKVTLSSENITVHKTNGNSHDFLITALSYLNFTDLSTGLQKKQITAFANSTLKVYPNPANEVLKIDIKEQLKQPLKIELLSITGKVIYAGELKNLTGTNQINLSEFSKGLYLIRLVNHENIKPVKFIKN